MPSKQIARAARRRLSWIPWALGAVVTLASCSSSSSEPTWHVLATTLALAHKVPEFSFTADGELLLMFDDGLRTINRAGNPNDPTAFRPFEPAAPPGTGGILRAESGNLWLVDSAPTDAASKIDYRLVRGTKTWERVDGDPNATTMTRMWEASNGTLYALCSYPPALPRSGVRICFKKGDAPWQSGDRAYYTLDPTSVRFIDGISVFVDHQGGIVIGGELGLMRFVDGLMTAYSPVFTHTPKVSRAPVGFAGITQTGNFLYGVSNYGGAEPWVYEIRPDGLGRSWVDQGCVRIDPYPGAECQNGRFDQVWATQLPQLSPSGAAYQIWRVQNGDIHGVLMRARPNGTKWEVLADGNPFQDQNPQLLISPTTGKLYVFTTGLTVKGVDGKLGVENAGLYEMEEPELP